MNRWQVLSVFAFTVAVLTTFLATDIRINTNNAAWVTPILKGMVVVLGAVTVFAYVQQRSNLGHRWTVGSILILILLAVIPSMCSAEVVTPEKEVTQRIEPPTLLVPGAERPYIVVKGSDQILFFVSRHN